MAMSEVSPDTVDSGAIVAGSREDRKLELIGVIILAIASVLTAWSGFQSTKWSGVQAASYSQASAKRIESNRSASYGFLLSLNSQANFNNWLNFTMEGEDDLASVYASRLEAVLPEAWNAWLALDSLNNPEAPTTPLLMPEYQEVNADETAALEAEASTLFEQGQDANERGDNYVLVTVFFAVALFFSGISTSINFRTARLVLLGVALAFVVGGGIYLATMPVEF
jgi:hypothetical protein